MFSLASDLTSVDFSCPANHAWIEDRPSAALPRSSSAIRGQGLRYREIVAEIEALPAEHPAKEKLNEIQVRLNKPDHKGCSPCKAAAKRKARQALIDYWTAMQT